MKANVLTGAQRVAALCLFVVACSGTTTPESAPTVSPTAGPPGATTSSSLPATSEPATSEPATSEPATSEPATSEPATSAPATSAPADPVPPPVRTLLDAAAPLRRFTLGPDTLGVWICRVALDISDSIYNRSDLRLDLEPDTVAGLLDQYVGTYFRTLTHGQYRPDFVPAGEVAITKDQGSQDCVDQARARSTDNVDGLVVIADAEHGSNRPGGWGRPGDPCPADVNEPCPASVSGRATYIGASDFHPDWGPEPAADLQEHEIGHSLGFPHSGEKNLYTSALDLMSNSAAPREADPDRRDGPDTLAANRLAAGWLDLDDVTMVPEDGGTYPLVASNAATGPRLLVLPLDDLRFLTVEVIDNTGVNDHLPEPGVAIHLIDQRPEACRNDGSQTPCLNELRRQTPQGSASPHTELFGAGDTWTGDGWTVTVAADGPAWTVVVG